MVLSTRKLDTKNSYEDAGDSKHWGLAYLYRVPVIRYQLLLCALIALFAPINILDNLPSLYKLTSVMKSTFPVIDAYVKKSDFPQITEIYLCISWLSIPLHGYYGFCYMRMTLIKKKWGIDMRKKWLPFLTLVIVGLISSWIVLFKNTGQTFNLLPINSSRIALATGGWFFGGVGGTLGIAYIFAMLEIIFKQYFSKGR